MSGQAETERDTGLEQGDTVTVEIEATVVGELGDGLVDVNLNGHRELTLGGINLVVPEDSISNPDGVFTVRGPDLSEHGIEFHDIESEDIEYGFWRCDGEKHVFAAYHGDAWALTPWKCPYCGNEEISELEVDTDG